MSGAGNLAAARHEDPVCDVVFTWVNGADPEFIEARKRYGNPNDRSHSAANRFQDNEELRYAVRAILKHIPWVRRIYVLTNGMDPAYLRPDGERLIFVHHSEVFDNGDHLPTFNSMAIECHLHRIAGLSEHFIYFNDDCFLGQDLTPDYFYSSGRLRALLERRSLRGEELVNNDEYGSFLASTDFALTRIFGALPRLSWCHGPYFYVKSEMSLVDSIWKAELDQTSSHKFRNSTDVIFRGLYLYRALYKMFGERSIEQILLSHPDCVRIAGPKDYAWVPFGDTQHNYKKTLEFLQKEPTNFFCLQDHGDGSASLRAEMRGFLENLYPCRSPWEEGH